MEETRPAATAAADSNPRGRGSVRRALVEQEILDRASQLFAEQGFARTSLQDIAAAVGLTRPALYHYVDNKEELLARLVAESTQEPVAEMAAIAQRTDLGPGDKLHQIVATGVRRQGEHPDRLLLLIRSASDIPEEIAAHHREGRRQVLRLLIDLIEAGVAAGAFRPVDARVAALGITGMINWIAWWIESIPNPDLDAISNQLAEQAVAGLVDPSAGESQIGPAAHLAAIRRHVDRLERTLDR